MSERGEGGGKQVHLQLLAICLAVLFGLMPVGVYLAFLGFTPTIHAQRAILMLEDPAEMAALIDVRPEPAYQVRHISGAIWLPLEQILEMDSAGDLPAAIRGKTLLVVCEAGVHSARAVRHLKELGVTAYNIRGGIQDWGRAWPQLPDTPFSRFEMEAGFLQEPIREMPVGEQGAAMLALLWIKPAYMLLSGLVSLGLLRNKAVDLRLLGWGLLVFLCGEIACAINYLFLKDNSYLAEYIHSYSMVVAFGLAAYALFEGLDERLIHFSQADVQCALLPVCGPCAKYKQVRCGIRRLAQLGAVSLGILSFIPLLAPYSYTAYNTRIGPVIHYYVRPFVHQWVESRFSPVVGFILVLAGLLVMAATPRRAIHPLARALLCGGIGFSGFGFFRVTLGLVYAERLVWATFWEEATELMFVVGVIYFLWVFFYRRGRGSPGEQLLGYFIDKHRKGD